MGLFKNEVGRPSNDILKKRRIVYISIFLVAVLATCLSIFYGIRYFKEATIEGIDKNASSSSIYTNISIRNNSSYIYIGNEKTKEGDIKNISSKRISLFLDKLC